MLLLSRAFVRALKAPPIAPSALSDFRAVGRGGASRRLRRGFGAGPQGGAIAMSLGCCSTPFWAIPGRLGLGFEVVELKFEVWGLGFKALGLGFGVLGLGLAVWGLGLAVWGLGSRF